MLSEILESTEASFACYCLMPRNIGLLLYPKPFHVTCVAHLLHNCAMEIKSHFEDVDQLIAKVKAVTIKNKTRQAKFYVIGYPSHPVSTSWRSWLNAALHYAKTLLEVKQLWKVL